MESESSTVRTARPDAVSAASQVRCNRCGSDRIHRMQRIGFREERLYPLFGYFPWHCSDCRNKFYLKNRYRRRDKKKEYVE